MLLSEKAMFPSQAPETVLQFAPIIKNFFLDNGLPALFFLSFLASTLIPLGSEWLLVVLIINGYSVESVVTIATLGNSLGACTTYLIGLWGSDFLITKVLRVSNDNLATAQSLYRKYGPWSLLLSWLPVVGDPLCLLGGIFRLQFYQYLLLIFSGKLARYVTVALVTKDII
jgi:membrane protein YqaA with SNARE-associated domain